jgi:putative transposase
MGNAFGKQVHPSGIGGLKSRLRNSFETPIIILGFEPTPQECFACSNLCKLSLLDKIIKCECGWQCYQDTNSALVALRKGLSLSFEQAVGLDWSELTPL